MKTTRDMDLWASRRGLFERPVPLSAVNDEPLVFVVLLLEVLRLGDLELALGHGPLGLEVGALGEEVEVARALRAVDIELELGVQAAGQRGLAVKDVIAL